MKQFGVDAFRRIVMRDVILTWCENTIFGWFDADKHTGHKTVGGYMRVCHRDTQD